MQQMGRWVDQIDPTPMFRQGAFLERWYRNHARRNERLWVIKLSNGRPGLVGGRVLVSDDRATIEQFREINYVNGRIDRVDLPEGTRIHRLPPRR